MKSGNVRFAVLIAMGGDDEDLGKHVAPDLEEMARGVSDEVVVLALVDVTGPAGSQVVEVLSDGPVTVETGIFSDYDPQEQLIKKGWMI